MPLLAAGLALAGGTVPASGAAGGESVQLALALAEAGRVEEAARMLELLAERAPRDPAPLVELGRLEIGRGRYAEAAARLDAARRLAADPRAESLLAQALLQMDRREEARAALQRALALDPNDPGSRYNLGRILRLQGESAAAVAEFRRALDADPDPRLRSSLEVNLGLAYLDLRRFAPAAAVYEGLVRAHPERAEYRASLASALDGLGETGRALEQAREAARLKPDLPEAHRLIGSLLRTRGELDPALDSARRAVQLAPADPGALALLAALLLDRGETAEALRTARRLVAADPRHSQGHYLLAQALLARGEREEAEREFETHRRLAAERRSFHHTAASIGDD
jgi:Flp pilus assembly protein TadD